MLPDENGIDGWLRYAPLPSALISQFEQYGRIIALSKDDTSPVFTAAKEVQKGLKGILNQEVEIGHSLASYGQDEDKAAIIIGIIHEFSQADGDVARIPPLKEDGFWLDNQENKNVQILGQNARGALYGAFEFLMLLAQGKPCPSGHSSNPSAPIRWVNQWDNLDG
ncbi:hypothetical protein F66182_18567, partial [Fusarium sp. NRRL 66182]